jgi:hypothetical protein
LEAGRKCLLSYAWFASLCLLFLGCQSKPQIVYRYVGTSKEVPFLAAQAKVQRERAWAKKDYEEYNYYVGVIDGLQRSIKVQGK